jgi:hypothetical protein
MVQSEFILILDDREIVTDTARFLRKQALNVRAFTDLLLRWKILNRISMIIFWLYLVSGCRV